MGHVEMIHVIMPWVWCQTLCGNVFDIWGYVLPVYIKLAIAGSVRWDELKINRCTSVLVNVRGYDANI